MLVRGPHYSKEEFSRRGRELYGRFISPQVEAANTGKFVAIDIDSETYEIADSLLAACDRLEARYPDAQTWLKRIGYRSNRLMSTHRRYWRKPYDKGPG